MADDKVDWTADQTTRNRCTSPLFSKVCAEVEATLANHIADFHAGRLDDIAKHVVALLAHHSLEVHLIARSTPLEQSAPASLSR